MSKYLAPLGIFVGGQFLILIVLLFFPAIGSAADQLASDTAGMASTFWGWTWVVSGTRLWVLMVLEGIILFVTAKAFLGLKS